MAKQMWKFYVKEGREMAFVEMNVRDWPDFFGGSPEYRGTRVSRMSGAPRTYLTEDHWTSKSAFDDYVARNKTRYDELSRLHTRLCEGFEEVGFFDDIQSTPDFS